MSNETLLPDSAIYLEIEDYVFPSPVFLLFENAFYVITL